MRFQKETLKQLAQRAGTEKLSWLASGMHAHLYLSSIQSFVPLHRISYWFSPLRDTLNHREILLEMLLLSEQTTFAVDADWPAWLALLDTARSAVRRSSADPPRERLYGLCRSLYERIILQSIAGIDRLTVKAMNATLTTLIASPVLAAHQMHLDGSSTPLLGEQVSEAKQSADWSDFCPPHDGPSGSECQKAASKLEANRKLLMDLTQQRRQYQRITDLHVPATLRNSSEALALITGSPNWQVMRQIIRDMTRLPSALLSSHVQGRQKEQHAESEEKKEEKKIMFCRSLLLEMKDANERVATALSDLDMKHTTVRGRLLFDHWTSLQHNTQVNIALSVLHRQKLATAALAFSIPPGSPSLLRKYGFGHRE